MELPEMRECVPQKQGLSEGLKAGLDKEHWADIDEIHFGANTK